MHSSHLRSLAASTGDVAVQSLARRLFRLREDTNVPLHGDTVPDPSQAQRMGTDPTVKVWFSGSQEPPRLPPGFQRRWIPEAVLALDRGRATRPAAVDRRSLGIDMMTGTTPVGGIQAAITSMVSAARQAHEERLQREAIWRLIQLTDGMIEELEELNLRGVRSVSDSWRPLLVLLCASLPFQLRVRFVSRPSPTELLDVLFDIQQALFDLKNARSNRRAVNGRARRQRRGGLGLKRSRSRIHGAADGCERRNRWPGGEPS